MDSEMKSGEGLRIFGIATAVFLSLAQFIACGGGGSDGPQIESGTDGGGGSSASGDCLSRCKAVSSKCSAPSNMCADLCPSLNESQMKCLESSTCDLAQMQQCFGSSDGGLDGSVDADAAQKDSAATDSSKTD